MAARVQGESPKNANPGDTLLAVHEFVARSPDEIGLTKGDRVELIEKDDDFGDGWYLGKHLQRGTTGLFPEVYTILAPKASLQTGSRQTSGTQAFAQQTKPSSANDYPEAANAPQQPALAAVATDTGPRTPPPQQYDSAAAVQQAAAGQQSPPSSSVMNEMHNVINEHITDLNHPKYLDPPTPDNRPTSIGSNSQYSNGRDYIPGPDSDEEEEAAAEGTLTEQNVKTWSPDKVARYLQGVGVEPAHCDLFRDEEFSGEVVLEMDQAQLFMKELDLGPIGRRMKTWQKIKSLQDEVKFGSVGMSYAGPNRAVSAGSTATLPRAGATGSRGVSAPYSSLGRTLSQGNTRPSAAVVRGIGQGQRGSSAEQALTGPPASTVSHGQQPSLDAGWTMPGQQAVSGGTSPRPTSTRVDSSTAASQISLGTEAETLDADRDGAGGEGDSKRTRKLRKRDTSMDKHKRQSSYGSDSRRSSKAYFWQKTRGESRDDIKSLADNDSKLVSQRDGVRIVSEPVTGSGSPTVTTLEYDDDQKPSIRQSAPYANKPLPPTDQMPSTNSDSQPPSSRRGVKGLRTISDAITGRERALVADSSTPPVSTPATLTESPIDAQAGSGASSTTVADANKSEFSTSQQGAQTPGKRKSKQKTSAYQRGLEKKTPQEQSIGAEYCGWMRKRSSNLLTTWKPRYFVLKGRRLSYYYSMDDTEEKGLIDISNHRVLPANNDFLTGLHATLTGANNNSPLSPSTPTLNGGGFGSSPYNDSTTNSSTTLNGDKSDNQSFIFKLVPPRSGLSKGVNFTKPAVHYFACPSRSEGRLWMAALMKSTIDRDEATRVVTTYQQKTISLEQARARRELPPFLRGVDERGEEGQVVGGVVEGGPGGGPGTVVRLPEGAGEVERGVPPSSIEDGGALAPSTTITSSNFGSSNGTSAPPPPTGTTTTDADATPTTASSSTMPVAGNFDTPELEKVQREGPADLPRIMPDLEDRGVVGSPRSSTSGNKEGDKRTSAGGNRTSGAGKGLGIKGWVAF